MRRIALVLAIALTACSGPTPEQKLMSSSEIAARNEIMLSDGAVVARQLSARADEVVGKQCVRGTIIYSSTKVRQDTYLYSGSKDKAVRLAGGLGGMDAWFEMKEACGLPMNW